MVLMDMKITQRDRSILRQLAEKQAAIAAIPVHKSTIENWKRMYRLEAGKPMVWINEICWPEMGDELRLQTENPLCREAELQLRQTIYQWEHLRADMVVEPRLYWPIVVRDSGFGIQTKERTIPQDESGFVASHSYESVIKEEADIEKIRTPEIEPDWSATKEQHRILTDLFGDILPVEMTARSTWWFAPWDLLVQWWGVQQALVDLVLRPEMVHHAMDRLVSAHIAVIEQYERHGLLSLNNGNVRIGSGGLGYTDLLPAKDFDGEHVRIKDLWGCGTAQIFSEVSPEMHWEFALKHELRWLEKFGLTYYGCCEPLHRKMHILKRIPNLRSVSMSPRADFEEAAAALGDKYVYSMKPNPAILVWERWNPEAARRELRLALEKTRGCVVEIIMKDISTVRNEPQRLWEWARIASEVSAEFG